jgi:HSP20 family protein
MTMAILMEPAAAPWLRDLNRLFSNEAGRNPFVPPADVIVRNEDVTIYMDVPGMRAEDLEIELEQDTLSVRGERAYPYGEDEDEDGVWRRIERGFGRFERSLRVPQGLNPDAIQAELTHGVLELRIPKPESLKPHRIPIQAHDGGGAQPQVVEGSAQDQNA